LDLNSPSANNGSSNDSDDSDAEEEYKRPDTWNFLARDVIRKLIDILLE